MKLNIGNTIKYLRKDRGITQEELADIIGISYQSVSRWECGACYPDVELLPVIADFFGITVDKLLGVNEKIEQEKIAQYLNRFQEAISQGKVYDCIAICSEGLGEYQNNFTLLNKLMYALFVSGDNDGNIPEWKENMERNDAEITALGERIMKYCPDQDIRLEATARLAFNHCEMGRKEIGRMLYETLPSAEFCKENQMWWCLSDEEKLPFIKKRIKQNYEALRGSVWLLASSGCVSDEQSIDAMKKVFEIEKVIYDNGHTPDGWGTAKLQVDLAKLYIKLEDRIQAMVHLNMAASAARAFDERPDKQMFSSSLLGCITEKKSDFETADTRPLCEIMRDKWLSSPEFDKVRSADEFIEIMDYLK